VAVDISAAADSTSPSDCWVHRDPTDLLEVYDQLRNDQYRLNRSCIVGDVVVSVQPAFGPVAGSTAVVITSVSFNMLSVAYVLFGADRVAVSAGVQTASYVVVYTPKHLTNISDTVNIILVTTGGGGELMVRTTGSFEFRANPSFSGVSPVEHLIDGGTAVTVTGNHLDSVYDPHLFTTVVSVFNNSLPVISSQLARQGCSVIATASPPSLLCQMPPLGLPSPVEQWIAGTGGGIVDVSGPGVAAWRSADGRWRVDVYLGLKLDGLSTYENISVTRPDIKVRFFVKPTINCPSTASKTIQFDPKKDAHISFTGKNLLTGCQATDYRVQLGGSETFCPNVDVTAGSIICSPPSPAPNNNINTSPTLCPADAVSVKILIGYATYPDCACLEYSGGVSGDSNRLMRLGLGLGLGLGLPLLILCIVVILLVVLCLPRFHRRSKPIEAFNSAVYESWPTVAKRDKTAESTEASDVVSEADSASSDAASSIRKDPRTELL
jgi:hypothetical protein